MISCHLIDQSIDVQTEAAAGIQVGKRDSFLQKLKTKNVQNIRGSNGASECLRGV